MIACKTDTDVFNSYSYRRLLGLLSDEETSTITGFEALQNVHIGNLTPESVFLLISSNPSCTQVGFKVTFKGL